MRHNTQFGPPLVHGARVMREANPTFVHPFRDSSLQELFCARHQCVSRAGKKNRSL